MHMVTVCRDVLLRGGFEPTQSTQKSLWKRRRRPKVNYTTTFVPCSEPVICTAEINNGSNWTTIASSYMSLFSFSYNFQLDFPNGNSVFWVDLLTTTNLADILRFRTYWWIIRCNHNSQFNHNCFTFFAIVFLVSAQLVFFSSFRRLFLVLSPCVPSPAFRVVWDVLHSL